MLRPELGEVLGAERFLREIRLTATLQHPHILPLLDSGEAASQFFYVMPYVEGESLRQRLQREGQLPLGEALRLTREVANVSAPLVEYESSLAATDSSIWFISDSVSTLTRLDVGTNRVVARIRVRPGSTGVATGFGAVWVSNTGTSLSDQLGSIQRVDPSSNRVRATIAVGRKPRFLAAGEGAVWVLNQSDGTVSRIDPATNQVVATIEAGVSGPGGDIAAGGGRVWVRAEKVLLTVIDPASNRIVHRFGPPAGSGAVRVGPRSVWVSAHDVNTIWELSLDRGR